MLNTVHVKVCCTFSIISMSHLLHGFYTGVYYSRKGLILNEKAVCNFLSRDDNAVLFFHFCVTVFASNSLFNCLRFMKCALIYDLIF